MNRVGYIFVALLFTGCFAKKESLPELKSGIWRATVEIQGRELPFNFEVKRNNTNDIRYLLDKCRRAPVVG